MTTTGTQHQQLLHDLRELAPAPAPGGVPDDARARIETVLLATIEEASRPQRARGTQRLALLGPGVLVAACLAAIAALLTVSVVGTSSDAPSAEPLPVLADPGAVRALHGLAAAASTTPTPTVREDQFTYVRLTVIENEGHYGGGPELGAPHEREVWQSQVEAATKDQGLIREYGQDWPIVGAGAPAGRYRPTYRWISTLPRDPDELISELASHQDPESPQTSAQHVFETIGNLILEDLVPPDVAGTLLQAVTKLPGVELVEQAEDAIGRTGFGISRTDEFSGITAVWIFRPGSPMPLGARSYFAGPASAPDEVTLFGVSAVLERGVVDRIGVRPGAGDPMPA
ncbi:CU044_5270 family protein [Nocardioides dongkuii]|uniref:CU044_5270 family protein n=1 Tax=Nocardioides dongkuii TaxID=2760089 RepID=UPI0015F89911|nr:CU044_5270 family protein [Nocardioides dongkuii]